MRCYFVSDLHGRIEHYEKLFEAISRERPAAVFIGGDILPSSLRRAVSEVEERFIEDWLAPRLEELKARLKNRYPRIFVILGNDDGRFEEVPVQAIAARGLWDYVHARSVKLRDWTIFGYSYVPPTPFRLKDWERYDVSRFVDPGCVSPEEGLRTVPVSELECRWSTIQQDLGELTADMDPSKSICLFHSPPHDTALDRAALDGQMVDHVPLDVHVGSVAIRRFIETRQPLLTLHGHIHESARITGSWRESIGRTHCLSAAHDGQELALVKFDPAVPEKAARDLI